MAGIRAVLDFAAGSPDEAAALTISARRRISAGEDPEREVLAYFADMLGRRAPQRLFPAPSDTAIVESIATVIRGHLLDGTAERLPGMASDLIYLSLMPHVGLEEARAWSASASLASN